MSQKGRNQCLFGNQPNSQTDLKLLGALQSLGVLVEGVLVIDGHPWTRILYRLRELQLIDPKFQYDFEEEKNRNKAFKNIKHRLDVIRSIQSHEKR